MYHSISEPHPEADLWGLEVRPRRFEQQIEALARTRDIISLAELGSDVRQGRLRPNTLAITFDDGYANNVSIAGPILRQWNAPATLFVCTGFIGRRAFWWDQLVDTIVTATRSPRCLPGEGLAAAETILRMRPRDRTPRTLHALTLAIWQALQPRALTSIDASLAELEDLFRPVGRRDDRRPMRASEVGAAPAYFAVGAHSVTHPPLSTLDDTQLAAEIQDSRHQCETLTGQRIRTFAYPFGDCDARVSGCVSQYMDLACATAEAPVGAHTGPYDIPRIRVGDWRPGQLIAKMGRVSRAANRSS